jgi:hypothetical protein
MDINNKESPVFSFKNSDAINLLKPWHSKLQIVSQDSLGMPRSRQCPREYFSAASCEPARNVFSRRVLHSDGLSIVLHLHRPYRTFMR